MTLYRNIIKESWLTMIRSKYLWFFGLFAMLLGNGGEYEILFRSIDKEEKVSILAGFWEQSWEIVRNLPSVGHTLWTDPGGAFLVLLGWFIVLAIIAFVAWLVNVSQAAIVDAVARQARDKENNLSIGLEKGIKFFWPVFFLNFTIKVLVAAGLFLLGYFLNPYLNVLIFLLLIPFLIVSSFVAKYVIAYTVVRKEKLKEAFVSAIKLFKKNWLISLELAFILYLATAVFLTVFAFATFNVQKFFEVIVFAFPTAGFIILYYIQPIFLFLLFFFIVSLLSVFQITAWTKLFLELDSAGAISKIERLFGKK